MCNDTSDLDKTLHHTCYAARGFSNHSQKGKFQIEPISLHMSRYL